MNDYHHSFYGTFFDTIILLAVFCCALLTTVTLIRIFGRFVIGRATLHEYDAADTPSS